MTTYADSLGDIMHPEVLVVDRYGAGAATYAAQAAMDLTLVCAQRLSVVRTVLRTNHLRSMIDSITAKWWPDAIAGHMTLVYVFGTLLLDLACLA